MAEISHAGALAAECLVFCRYLLGQDAPPDVIAAYRRAHEYGSAGPTPELTVTDRALLGIACRGPRFARIADAYAGAFAPTGPLRRKLVLLVAILESREPSAAALDTATPGTRPAWVVEAALRVAGWAMAAGAGALLLTLVRVWYRLTGR